MILKSNHLSGVLLYFMLTGGMPFRAENVSKLKKCILEGTYIIPPYISEDAASLIRAILIGGCKLSYPWCNQTFHLFIRHFMFTTSK